MITEELKTAGEYTAEDFQPATSEEKRELVVMRDSVSFWKDGMRRLFKNKLSMFSFFIIALIMFFSFVVPQFYPYDYRTQIRGNENLSPMQYSPAQQAAKEAGEKVFPHIFGTDNLGRDYAVRVMMGTRVSFFIGILSSLLILVIGAVYGAVSGYLGGRVDLVMQRIVEIVSTVPDILVIILLSVTLKFPLKALAEKNPSFAWINTVGVPLVSIFLVFGLLYWVGMARLVRSQVLTLKESEYVTAAKALGASNWRIITKHLLTNCIGTLIAATTLQIPQVIFTESFLSFLGIGVAAPLTSLGSLASDAINGIKSYPHRLLIPAFLISLIILTLNLFGDGLRDAFDPKLKN